MSAAPQPGVPTQIGCYTIRGTIGEGSFSVVNLCFNKINSQFYACKIAPKARLHKPDLVKRFELEVRIGQQLHHPGIVAITDLLEDATNYYMIMEFCPGGELFQYIVDRDRLVESEAAALLRQLLDALRYIHSFDICHRDLKLENLLFDQLGRLKVSDFGLSRFSTGGLVSTPCGSPCYASPECLSNSPYSGKTNDLWSCGVILFAMVTGRLPWTKRNQLELFAQIRRGEYKIPSTVSAHCRDLITRFLTVDYNARITLEEALEHAFLKGVPLVTSVLPPKGYLNLKRIDAGFLHEEEDPVFKGAWPKKPASVAQIDFGKGMRLMTSKFVARGGRPVKVRIDSRSSKPVAKPPSPAKPVAAPQRMSAAVNPIAKRLSPAGSRRPTPLASSRKK
jgi:serine/threonine protein kinase